MKSLIKSRKSRGYEDVEQGGLKFCACSGALKNRRGRGEGVKSGPGYMSRAGSLCRKPCTLVKRNKNQLCDYMTTGPGARFSKVPIINEPRMLSPKLKIDDGLDIEAGSSSQTKRGIFLYGIKSSLSIVTLTDTHVGSKRLSK